MRNRAELPLDHFGAAVVSVRPYSATLNELVRTTRQVRRWAVLVFLIYISLRLHERGQMWMLGVVCAIVVGYEALAVTWSRTFGGPLPFGPAVEIVLLSAFVWLDPQSMWACQMYAVVVIGVAALNSSPLRASGTLTTYWACVSAFASTHLDEPIWPILISISASLALVVPTVMVARRLGQHNATQTRVFSTLDAFVWEEHPTIDGALIVGEGAERILGYPAQNWLEPDFWRKISHPEDLERIEDAIDRQQMDLGTTVMTTRMRDADGLWRWIENRVASDANLTGRHRRFGGVMADRTHQVTAQLTANRLADVVFASAAAHMLVADRGDGELSVIAANAATTELARDGWRDLVNLRLADIEFAFEFGRDLVEVIRSAADQRVAVKRQVSSGGEQIFELEARQVAGDAIGVSMENVTERVQGERQLRKQALSDSLTGLPNRSGLREEMERTLTEETLERRYSLLVLDLNQFKEVNDALGHHVGDALLQQVAIRLAEALPEQMIARLGGDEFAIFGQGSRAVAERNAMTAIDALEGVFQIQDFGVQSTASIGVAVWPEHGESPDLLMQHADVAMYAGKRKGGGYVIYSPEHDQSSIRRLNLIGGLRPALENNEFTLAFQPIVDVETGDVVNCEALLRWTNSSFGVVGPDEFIPLAEVSGVIRPMTRVVVSEAIDAGHRFAEVGFPIVVSCNMSARNLYETDLIEWITTKVEQVGLPPGGLRLELTETDVMEDPEFIRKVLKSLRRLGISSSIDDFGTGFSSLVHLRTLPVDFIKVDRSFVTNLTDSPEDRTIVRSLIELGHNLGMGVVAEGVENLDTLRLLADFGCDYAQGYYISRPRSEDEFVEFLRLPDRRVLTHGVERVELL